MSDLTNLFSAKDKVARWRAEWKSLDADLKAAYMAQAKESIKVRK